MLDNPNLRFTFRISQGQLPIHRKKKPQAIDKVIALLYPEKKWTP